MAGERYIQASLGYTGNAEDKQFAQPFSVRSLCLCVLVGPWFSFIPLQLSAGSAEYLLRKCLVQTEHLPCAKHYDRYRG